MPTVKRPRYVPRNARLTIEEHDIITAAADAMRIQRSTLFQEGVIEAAHGLGFYAGADPGFRRRPKSWTDAPQRREESAAYRISVSYSITTYELLQRAADWAGVSETIFAVGATLRYISNLKKKGRKELQHIKLPKPYA